MTQAVRREGKKRFRFTVKVADLVRGFRLLVLAVAVVTIAWGGFFLYRKYDVPIAVIGVDGELKQVRAAEVEEIVANNLGGGFLSLDLKGICRALEEHAWIAKASAHRKWPNEVVIAVEEETPIARWGEQRFLNNKGKILDVADSPLLAKLPELDGPAGLERRVMQQYLNFTQVFRPLGLKVEVCILAPRGNWLLTFDNGLHLTVGKEPVAEKLNRFLRVWDVTLRDQVEKIANVDIRYANGVAVKWKEVVDASEKADSKS